MDASYYSTFNELLHNELLTALGCTEPVCIAYCAARMREALGEMPDQITVKCSGNIVKNVKGAIVPNSGNMKGIDAAATLGVIGGDTSLGLEVLTKITESDIRQAKSLLSTMFCRIQLLESDDNLHVIVIGYSNGHKALAEIKHKHTQVVRVEKDDTVIFSEKDAAQETEKKYEWGTELTIERIVDFAENVDLQRYNLDTLIQHQIDCNVRIAKEGLHHAYGACVGSTILSHFENNVGTRAKAYAAAGSDARMSGCELPVVINSGSGNQGLTVTLPVIEYAKELHKSREELIRALLISNLVAMRIKASYGRLSAFCGAVSAATGSGAAITWLHGGTMRQIESTIINTLADISGMVCDGAKASCASKIASAIDTAIMSHYMSMDNRQFMAGDGLVKSDIEETIQTIGRMASEGMVQTDRKILQLMLEQ